MINKKLEYTLSDCRYSPKKISYILLKYYICYLFSNKLLSFCIIYNIYIGLMLLNKQFQKSQNS